MAQALKAINEDPMKAYFGISLRNTVDNNDKDDNTIPHQEKLNNIESQTVVNQE